MAGFLARITGGLLRPRTLQAGSGITITNPAGDAGDPTIAAIVGGSGINQLTGDVTAGPGTGSVAATISPNAVTDADLRQSAALSVMGRSANSIGNEADIAAGADGNVLRRSGTTLGFGAIALGSANAVAGTLADANLSANVPLLNAANLFTAQQAFQGGFSSFGGIITSSLLDLQIGQIKFPATQFQSTNVNTLDDYEEGTWAASDASGAGLTFSGIVGNYLKIGKKVTLTGILTYPATASGAAAKFTGLPFTAQAPQPGGGGNCPFSTPGIRIDIYVRESTGNIELFTTSGLQVTNTQMSGQTIAIAAVYFATQ